VSLVNRGGENFAVREQRRAAQKKKSVRWNEGVSRSEAPGHKKPPTWGARRRSQYSGHIEKGKPNLIPIKKEGMEV